VRLWWLPDPPPAKENPRRAEGSLMETSVSLMERLAGSPTDDDWRRLELFEACGHFVQTDSTPAGILELGE